MEEVRVVAASKAWEDGGGWRGGGSGSGETADILLPCWAGLGYSLPGWVGLSNLGDFVRGNGE